ncbi:MAG: cell division protein ZapA [Candidatus Nitrotoga sp.]|nr:cell division protein ZapA [Candidatus Nitrotoga sp.]MDO9447478.1 cell division protein ZapA [Candidatus Nitrotoga sp.]MDP3497563.1 cell division protein ZapA [Candidatus Nitrotoga sp.]RFC38748.1 MAG: cell division protein ZapA [Candidatus Nitrotoga sp. CP45]
MSSESARTLDVTILDRKFRVACPEAERSELLDAVAYLDKKMHEIRDIGKVVTLERIAIMSALNITHELLTPGLGTSFDTSEFKRRMGSMVATIDALFAEQDELF